MRVGIPAAVGFTFRAAVQTDPDPAADGGYEIARAVLGPDLVTASFALEPGTGRVVESEYGELSHVNASLAAFRAFLAVVAEVVTRLHGVAHLDDPETAVVSDTAALWAAWEPALRGLLEIDPSAFADDEAHWYAEYFDRWETCGFPEIEGPSPFAD